MTCLVLENTNNNYPKENFVYKDEKKGLNLQYREYAKDKNKNIIYVKNEYMSYLKVERYFEEIAKRFPEIELNGKILSGMPVLSNTRIPVSLVLSCLKDEMTFQEICEEYKLSSKDVEKAVEYVIELLDKPFQEEL